MEELTAHEIAARTGIPLRTIQRWIAGWVEDGRLSQRWRTRACGKGRERVFTIAEYASCTGAAEDVQAALAEASQAA